MSQHRRSMQPIPHIALTTSCYLRYSRVCPFDPPWQSRVPCLRASRVPHGVRSCRGGHQSASHRYDPGLHHGLDELDGVVAGRFFREC